MTTTTTTYKGRTADEWREAASASARRSAESWERSDTDGFAPDTFVSQVTT